MSELLFEFAITLPALVLSLIFHEVAHGLVALRFGDKTAQSRGRLSLNPFRHLDRVGTIVLLLSYFTSGGRMLFGWAKPVPINPAYFKSPQRAMGWVGAAGPVTNFMLAAASAIILERWILTDGLLAVVIFRVFQLNLILMVFNLLPVPPLDGSRIVGAFLTRRSYAKWVQLDHYGMILVMGLLFLLVAFPGPFYDLIQSLYRVFLPSYGF